MCVPEVCSHEIVCVKDSFAPVAAAEEGAADVGGPRVQELMLNMPNKYEVYL